MQSNWVEGVQDFCIQDLKLFLNQKVSINYVRIFHEKRKNVAENPFRMNSLGIFVPMGQRIESGNWFLGGKEHGRKQPWG
ncbi:hypothetical protein TNCT_548861 [Trichonephila clavata]|uniref:Uncharacterized protein n=1 Tax=Trichonephila clavata TaxID=2740835 RepID=A0A8X6KH48_TRICU|nr:hypothetical protein TNCT_548861 [Trichonephila clavata]